MTDRDSIAKKRSAAGSIKVSTAEDQSQIVAMVPMDKMLLVVKEAGIYQFQFADQVDPDRTNIELPNVLQKSLGYGARDEFVGRILLTAERFFKSSHIPENFDHKLALQISLKIVAEIAGLKDIQRDIQEAIERGISAHSRQS